MSLPTLLCRGFLSLPSMHVGGVHQKVNAPHIFAFSKNKKMVGEASPTIINPRRGGASIKHHVPMGSSPQRRG